MSFLISATDFNGIMAKNYFLSSNYCNNLWKTKIEGNYLLLDVP